MIFTILINLYPLKILIISEFDINPIFSGFSKDDPKKVVFIHQTLKGNIKKFVQANRECIKSHKVDISSMEESSSI